MDKNISIIIGTYNRCESLRDTLDSMMTQENHRSFDYEVIIVDNNSKDKTKEMVESYMPRFNGRLKYIFEPSQGLSYARNRGIKESKGEIIVFTDDDVIVDKAWLLNIWKCFQDYNCDGVGGRILPLYPEKTPKWVRNNRALLGGPILNYDYGDNIQIYNNNFEPFVGANMAFKKYCFDKYGLFDTDLGAGKPIWSEDTEFFLRIEACNKSLYYCGKALAWHKVYRERISYRYLAKWYIRAGMFLAKQNSKRKDIVYYFGIPRYIFKELVGYIIMLTFNLFNTKRFLKYWKKIFVDIGELIEFKRIKTCQK